MATLLTETFYLTRDNTVDLILQADGAVTDLTNATKIEVLDTDCAWAVDSISTPAAFEIGTTDGSLKLKFGQEAIPAGTYRCQILVYDAVNDDGIVWDEIKLVFRASCPVPAP